MIRKRERTTVTMVTKEICAMVVVVLSFKSIDSKPQCPSGRYYDAVVRHCSPCSDICFNAAIQRTEMECRRECPDFKAVGTVKVFSDSEDHKPVAAIIVGTVIGTIITVGSSILVWKKRKDVREFICRMTDRNRNFEEVVNGNQTAAKELLVDGNAQDNGNSCDISDVTNRENEEMISMVPPTDSKNIAQVTDPNCAAYKPAF